MSTRRKSLINLEEIENPSQRAVAYIISAELHEQNLSNQEFANISGLSAATVSNIFRKNCKYLAGPKVLESMACGLSKDASGSVNIPKAKALYQKLMAAAQYNILSNPFSGAPISDGGRLNPQALKDKIAEKLVLLEYRAYYEILKQDDDERIFDLAIQFEGCPFLKVWNMVFFLQPKIPEVCLAQFIMGVFKNDGYRKDGKYTVVTDSKELQEKLLKLAFPDNKLLISVILVSEDYDMREAYVKTSLSHAQLDKSGLTF